MSALNSSLHKRQHYGTVAANGASPRHSEFSKAETQGEDRVTAARSRSVFAGGRAAAVWEVGEVTDTEVMNGTLPTRPVLDPVVGVDNRPLWSKVARAEPTRKWEQPWHRAAAYHFASGMNRREVARANGVSDKTISNLLREPWFQQNIVEIMAENGGKDVMDLIRGEAFNSLNTLIELRDDVTVRPQVRATIATDILDRVFGKATQRVETVGSPKADDPVAEVERLERENNRLAGLS